MSFDKFIIFAREYSIQAWKAHNDFLWSVYSKSVIWKCFLIRENISESWNKDFHSAKAFIALFI